MVFDEMFSPIDTTQLKELIENSTSSDLFSFKLLNGDILIGGIYEHGKRHHDKIQIAFNMPAGERYGQAQLVEINYRDINYIYRIHLREDSTPKLDKDETELVLLKEIGLDITHVTKLPIHNYPNPLATIIYEHNIPIATAHKFNIMYLTERALSQSGIPIEGIYFDKDFLMYIDWNFFQTQVKGEVSISAAPIPGLVQVEKILRLSPEEQVLQRLRSSLADHIRRNVSPKMGEYKLIQGVLLVPDPTQDEVIEGDVCHLYQVAGSIDGTLYPVLIKAKQLKFPRGFLNKVNSSLTFYGEFLPVPITVVGIPHGKILLARAIAYLEPN